MSTRRIALVPDASRHHSSVDLEGDSVAIDTAFLYAGGFIIVAGHIDGVDKIHAIGLDGG